MLQVFRCAAARTFYLRLRLGKGCVMDRRVLLCYSLFPFLCCNSPRRWETV